MLSYRDVEHRNIVTISSLKQKSILWGNGLIVVKDRETGQVATRLAVHRVLVIIVIGNATITTPLIERCKKYQIPLVFAKSNFRITAFIGNELEGNTALRGKQYQRASELDIAKAIIANKIANQLALLQRIRDKDAGIQDAISRCQGFAASLANCQTISEIMGFEGNAARLFFREYFKNYNWKGRKPRVKIDYINVILDIGYTMLFHYVEIMLRMWGFDLYVGNLHQCWFQRKSLVCDMLEPFRCIIDHQVCLSLALQQFQPGDFGHKNGQYYLQLKQNRKYSEVFLNCIQNHKADIYHYVRDYYRYFMGMKSLPEMPVFLYS